MMRGCCPVNKILSRVFHDVHALQSTPMTLFKVLEIKTKAAGHSATNSSNVELEQFVFFSIGKKNQYIKHSLLPDFKCDAFFLYFL